MYAGIVAGPFTVLAAPSFSRLPRFFPPVVTGTVITIGVSLMPVAIRCWASLFLGSGTALTAILLNILCNLVGSGRARRPYTAAGTGHAPEMGDVH